jgi:hypothetical protein
MIFLGSEGTSTYYKKGLIVPGRGTLTLRSNLWVDEAQTNFDFGISAVILLRTCTRCVSNYSPRVGALIYSIFVDKLSPYKGRILLIDTLGRRRPVGFVRECCTVRGGTL